MPLLIVISDLHMGSGSIDDFEPEIENYFVAFLENLRALDDAVELVINGDLLDFVQAPPYKGPMLRDSTPDGTALCFTEDQSCQKLSAIFNDHQRAFAALRAFLAHRPSNRLVVLPGNHDADFYWPAIRKNFQRLVCGDDQQSGQRLVFWLDPVYRPTAFPRIWIEHGHQHDSVNNFFVGKIPFWSEQNPPIASDRKGTARLHECIGTRFLILFLNDLDHDYPYVDNIKPFSRFLQLFGASALRPGYGSIKAALAVASMQAFLAKTLVTRPKDVLKIDRTKPTSAAQIVRAAFERAPPVRQQAFIESVRDRGYALKTSPKMLLASDSSAGSFLEFLTENLDLVENIEAGWSGGKTLKLASSFTADETNDLSAYAARVTGATDNSADCVIMGHTHEAVAEPHYINTGSWTRYYKVQRTERLRPWSLLRADSWNNFPYQLQYARIAPAPKPIVVLETYK